MSNIVNIRGSALPKIPADWRWRTSDGLMLRPSIMATRHLHHTLVMIWHHVMPEEARVRDYYRAYSFGPFYTDEYMMQAIRVMAAELASRTDLEPRWQRELEKMIRYLRFGGRKPKLVEREANL